MTAPSDRDSERWPSSLARNVDNLFDRFEAAWKAVASTGPRPRIELLRRFGRRSGDAPVVVSGSWWRTKSNPHGIQEDNRVKRPPKTRLQRRRDTSPTLRPPAP